MSKETVKTQIDIDITNKTTSKSISPLNVGSNMKAIIDLIPEGGNITKTNGSVVAINGSKATLQYDINTVSKSGGSEVKLPTTTEVGKEVLFLASNYAGTVSVYVNDAEDVKLSGGINGISGNQGNLQINANEAYRFIYLTNDYWYYEKIISIPNNYYQLVSERSTDGTLVSNSNFKYPTEQAVKTYVDTKDPRPYKVYTAILNQSGSDAPVAEVIENTLDFSISFSVFGFGVYICHQNNSSFTINKTICFIGSHVDGFLKMIPINQDDIYIYSSAKSGAPDSDIIANTAIEIRVYN